MRSNAYNGSWTADPLEAKDFSDESPNIIVKALDGLMRSNDSYETIELVRIKVTTEIDAVDINDGEILEERRRQALSKLNSMEVEALGVEKLAAYSKLKFHGEG
jgi:hypothetical protein